MRHTLFAAALGGWLALPVMAEEGREINATTSEGESVVLQPDGSWQYAEPVQRINGECPPKSQGGYFGTRCIPPGDKHFNRGSLSGKGR